MNALGATGIVASGAVVSATAGAGLGLLVDRENASDGVSQSELGTILAGGVGGGIIGAAVGGYAGTMMEAKHFGLGMGTMAAIGAAGTAAGLLTNAIVDK